MRSRTAAGRCRPDCDAAHSASRARSPRSTAAFAPWRTAIWATCAPETGCWRCPRARRASARRGREPRWTLALTATRAEDWINYDRVALARAYTGADGAQRDVTGSRLRSYWRDYTGQTHLRLSTSRDVGRGLTLLVIGDNLLGGQVGEPDNLTIRQGRTLSGGLRASF